MAEFSPHPGFWATLRAILRLRCPRCHSGKMFRGRFAMNDPCPQCGLIFQREEGYFLGAMYAGYFLSIALIVPLFLLALLLLPNAHILIAAVVALIAYAALQPGGVSLFARAMDLPRPLDLPERCVGWLVRKAAATRTGRPPTGAKRPIGRPGLLLQCASAIEAC